MPNKFNLTIVTAFALVVAHDIKSHIQRRKDLQTTNETFEILTQANDILVTECISQHARSEYLVHLLTEAGVELDEFDLIALNYRPK